MRFPSKNTSFSESIIAKFPMILDALEDNDISVSELFKSVKYGIEDVGEFIEILDCLYALGKVELNAETRCLYYVG
ncbi:MAG TPA: hypothetical protein PLJ83_11360 [Spirochaetales bacterium]|jgi:hypothetical protein|nr:hypothetical protein [Spirochaetales bacterium]